LSSLATEPLAATVWAEHHERTRLIGALMLAAPDAALIEAETKRMHAAFARAGHVLWTARGIGTAWAGA
jgi:hypothetical protein